MAGTGSLLTTAVVASRYGGAEVLSVRQWSVEEPRSSDVLIRVRAAGISYADLLMCQGLHPERRKPPFVLGWDVVGDVEAVGSDVGHVEVGDRVAALSIVGGWAQLATVRGDWVVPVPASVDAARAVCLVMDYVVAYQMLTRKASVSAGDTILVQGAGGGVGSALMDLARAMHVRVLGTDRGTKRAHVESYGGVLIDFEREDVVSRCRELTTGLGVDAAFDGIGATAPSSHRALRSGGRLVWFGMVTFLSGGGRDLAGMARTALSLARVFAPNARPGGKRTSVYSIQRLADKHPAWYRQDLGALLDLLAAGTIGPRVAAACELDRVPEAVKALSAGAPAGKQVVTMPGA